LRCHGEEHLHPGAGSAAARPPSTPPGRGASSGGLGPAAGRAPVVRFQVRVGRTTTRFDRTPAGVPCRGCDAARLGHPVRGAAPLMQPNKSFVGLPKSFWANVRTIGQEVGYTERPKRQVGVTGRAGPIKVPTPAEVREAFHSINLSTSHLMGDGDRLTDLGR